MIFSPGGIVGNGTSGVAAGFSDMRADALGVQKVISDYSLFQSIFTFDIPASIWLIYEDGVEVRNSLSTLITSVNGVMQINSGAGSSSLVSRRHPRYQPDRAQKYEAFMGFTGANSDGVLKAGLFVAEQDGVYFKTKGDGELYACIVNNSVETHEELITIPFDIDLTKGNLYDIQLLWQGCVKFYIANPSTGLPQVVHEINFFNTLDGTLLTRNPTLSLSFSAENITQPVTMFSGSVDMSSEGGANPKEQYLEYEGEKTVSSGDGLVAILSPDTINGRINTRDLRLTRISLSSDKKARIKVYITRDPTAIIGGTYATFSDGSFVEKNDTMSSVDTAKMSAVSTFVVQAGATLTRTNAVRDSIEFFQVRGDILVLVCDDASTALITQSIEWGEEV